MSTPHDKPLWSSLEAVVMGKQPAGYTATKSNGWYLYHSPLRDDDENPSFGIKPDTDGESGGFVDYATGDKGSMADLARRLDVGVADIPNEHVPTPVPPTFDALCQHRRLDPRYLSQTWKVEEVTFKDRPALRYPTSRGLHRIKFLDGGKPKYYWAEKGAQREWYGLKLALSLPGDTLYIVNGEPSVWAAQQAQVPATCLCGGEGNVPAPELVAELQQVLTSSHFTRVAVIYDRGEAHDKPGKGAQADATALRAADIEARAVRLPESVGYGGDVDDLHRFVGDDALATVLTGLTIVDFSIPHTNESNTSSNRAFHLTLLRDMLEEPDEALPWVVEDMLIAGGSSLLVAKPKVGKSTLARNLVLAISRGDPFLGRSTTQGAIVYLALEEKRSEVRKHFERMGAQDEPIFVHTGIAPEDALLALQAAIHDHHPALAVVDPLMRMIRLRDVNDYAQANRALEPLHHLARTSQCHILCVHHAGKGERVGGDVVLGSTALFGAVDTLLLMKQSNKRRTVHSLQRYGTDLPETVVTLDGDTGIVTAAGDAAALQLHDVSVAILKELGSTTQDEKFIKKRVGGNQTLVAKALRALHDGGLITRSGAGVKNDPYQYQRTHIEDDVECSISRLTDIENRTHRENRQSDVSAHADPSASTPRDESVFWEMDIDFTTVSFAS